MPDSRRRRVWIPTLAALVALLAFAPQAVATGYEEQPEHYTVPVGLLVKAADSEARTVVARIRCTGTSHDGTDMTFAVAPEVDMAALAVGREVGAKVDKSSEPKTIVALLEDDCPGEAYKPKPEQPKPVDSCDDDAARVSTEAGEEAEDGCLPQFVRRFISRVWRFVGEVDYYEDGELSMTLGEILNLPRKWRTQDDELLDQDTTVLVSERVRVFHDGKRVPREALGAANHVRVHGKLLRPRLWRVDEDGSPVPTIRAKKVHVTG